MLWLLIALACGTSSEPAETPPRSQADQLAERVAVAAGDPYQVPALTFTFIVRGAEGEVVRRAHVWCPREQRATVQAGDKTFSLDLAQPDQTDAYGWHINDGYWLFAPSKVLDAGVVRAQRDGALTLTFEGVGLTPGDQYALTLDAAARVTGWRYTLQSGRTGAFQWRDYERVGPLLLSMRRISDDGREIAFEGVTALPDCPLG